MANILTNHETRLDSHEIQITGNKLLAETALSRTNANQSLTDYNSLMMNKNTDKITALETTVQSNTDKITALELLPVANTDKITALETTVQSNTDKITALELLPVANTDKITALETTVQSNTNDIIFLQNSKNSSTDNSSIVFSNIKKCVSQIAFILNGGSYIGSGWFFAENTEDLVKGYYITAAHCVMEIRNNNYLKTTFAYIQNPITNKWTSINVNNIYIDGIADVALIQTNIDFTNYPNYCLQLADKMPEAGTQCYVVGNPGGLNEDSISSGCIRDSHYTETSGYQITDSIHVSAPGMGGNSGGPILNPHGKVIAIYTFGLGGGYECFGGGSNIDVLKSTLSVLKTGQNNKSKLFLGLYWTIPSPFVMRAFYNSPIFDVKGVYINSVNRSYSPFVSKLSPGDLLLSCSINSTGEVIEFGGTDHQRTPGVLLYYPQGTVITITYIKNNQRNIMNSQITLTKTYDSVPNTLDGPLQTGLSGDITKKCILVNPKIKLDR